MDAKYRGRKWKAFIYVMALESAVLIMAGIKMVGADDSTIISALTVFMAACFGAINATLGFYFASNIAQKKVVGG